MAIARRLRVGPQKLNLVAAAIRGRDVNRALAELSFSRRRIAGDVKKALQSAIANAENNHQLVMKRFRPRARGRVARIAKSWSRLRVVVRERAEG